METEEVREACEGIIRSSWKDLAGDLKMLKAYVRGVVEEVGWNELMIDADANGVGYLTCVKVGREDLGWVKGD